MENKLTNTESLKIIEQMINRAKNEEKDSGKGWIMWGWMLTSVSIIHYFLILYGVKGSGNIWIVFGVFGLALIAQGIYKRRTRSSEVTVKTYTGELVGKIGDAFFISLMVSMVGAATTGAFNSGVNFGYLLLLYAFWLYIHGAAFRFEPMKYGAYVNWLGALAIFLWYRELGKNVLIVHAICVILGYIIPGYMAQRKFDQQANTKVNG